MLVIFDWDGTLADSQSHIVAAMQLTIDELNFPTHSDNQCAAMIGLGLREVGKRLCSAASESDIDQFCARYSHHFLALEQSQFALSLFEGARETLDILRANRHSLAIATGKSRRGLNRVLKALDLEPLFVATRAADETASKPNPLMLQALLDETGYAAQHAVMVGDTSYDMEMARAIGMPRVAATYGVHDVDILRAFKPALIIDTIADIIQWPEFYR
jgi:phosphoglycolate phosphatase